MLGVATAGLGVLESTHVTALVAQYPGTFATVIGIAIIVMRFVTTSAIFKD